MSISVIENEDWELFPNAAAYSISSMGRVYSNRQEKLICENTPKTVYRNVGWIENGEFKSKQVSVIVMDIFGPPNPNKEYYTCVDHIDQNIHNDAISNLRYLPTWQNTLWSDKHVGCTFDKCVTGTKKYRARIKTPVKHVSLGYFNTKEEAMTTYRIARHRAMQISLGDLVIRKPESIEQFVKTGVW